MRRRSCGARNLAISGGECLDHLVQAALVSCSLVLVDDAFGNHRVNHRHGRLVCSSSGIFVAFLTRL